MSTAFQTLLAMCDSDDGFFVNRKFVRFAGSLEAGIVLTRLMMWTPHSRDLDGWVYKSDADWMVETCLSQYSVRRARAALEQMGVVETCVRQVKRAPIVHYRIKPAAMVSQWRAWLKANPVLANSKDPGILRKRKNDLAKTKEQPFDSARSSLSHERHARKTDMSSSVPSAPASASVARPDDDDDFLRSVFDLYRQLTGLATVERDRVSAEKLRAVPVEVVERVMIEVRRRKPREKIYSLEYFVEEVLRAAAELAHRAPDIGALPEAPEVVPAPVVAVAPPPRARPAPPPPTRGALALSVAPEPAAVPEISADTKTRVFAHVADYLPRFAATHGRPPSRDELRAHLVEWCVEARLDCAIVDAMYPPPRSASPPPQFPAPVPAPPAPAPAAVRPASDPGESEAGETERRRREFLDGLAALRNRPPDDTNRAERRPHGE